MDFNDNISGDDELEVETRRTKEFIKNNPYYTYNEMLNSMLKCGQLDFASEYGEYNHELCKKIYENITDRKIVRECGKLINKRGGFMTMQANRYAISIHSPLRKSNDMSVRAAYTIIDYCWHGVGRWRC